jgi:hypothetical protein
MRAATATLVDRLQTSVDRGARLAIGDKPMVGSGGALERDAQVLRRFGRNRTVVDQETAEKLRTAGSLRSGLRWGRHEGGPMQYRR